MQGLLIDPAERTVLPVDYDDWQDIAPLLGCTTFDTVPLLNGDTVYVDDEGLFKENQTFFLFDEHAAPLAGKGLITGGASTAEWVKDNIDFGRPMRAGPIVLFIGDRVRREIRA